MTQIAKSEFQVEPTQKHTDGILGNEMARFRTTIEFDGKEVGYAIGRNKKESKLIACKHILMAMCPQLYEDWQRSRKVNTPGT